MRAHSVVKLLVPDQALLPRETLPALRTRKRPQANVVSLMVNEVPFLVETFPALWTLKRKLPGVNSLVRKKVPFLTVTLPTL